MLSSFRSVFSAHKRTLFALTLVLALALTCTPAFADESSGMPESDSVVPSIGYRSHLSNVGWGSLVEEGVESGNRLGSNPVECVELTLEGIEGDVRLSGRYLICGETDFQEVSGGASCSFGTTGRGKRLNAIAIDSPSGESDSFDIYYRVYLEHYGWLEWATNSELAGSNDPSLKIYAVQMVVARSGSPSPVVEDSTAGTSYIQLADLITYSAHVAGIGWLPSVSEGSVAGTTGRSLSMEALRVSLGSQAAPGAVEARGHVAGLGWQDWSEGGCGTEGRAKALEAVCLRLTGEAADAYDCLCQGRSFANGKQALHVGQ